MVHKYISWRWLYIIFLPITLFVVGCFFHDAQADVFYEDFSANITENQNILLEWWTDTEVNNEGFYIQRSLTQLGLFQRLESSYTPSESQNGEGGYYYFFVDESVVPNQTYFYRVEAIDIQGNSTVYGPISAIVRVGSTYTPTITGTSSIQPTMPLITPSREFPSSTLTATYTRTFEPQRTPELSETSRITDEIVNTPDPNRTTTATFTKTLEPLPTIDLILPVSPTSKIQNEGLITPQVTLLAPTPTLDDRWFLFNNVSDRLAVLIGIVGFLWLSLGIFLVYMIRKLN